MFLKATWLRSHLIGSRGKVDSEMLAGALSAYLCSPTMVKITS